MKAVSFFSNCGAGDTGYAAAGFDFTVIAEIVTRRLAIASLNHPSSTAVPGDLRKTWPVAVDAFREAHGHESPVLLSGCPPCQGMSSARGARGREADADAGSRDQRNLLVLPIARAAAELKPTFVVVENVPAFLRRKVRDPAGNEPLSAARLLCRRLQEDYRVYALLANLCDYGVPQNRTRAFLTFVRRGTAALEVLERAGRAPFPEPTHGAPGLPEVITIDEAFRKLALPPLDARSADSAESDREAMHRVPVLCGRLYNMVAAIPPGSGASAWTADTCRECGFVNSRKDSAVCSRCEEPLLRPVVRGLDGSWRLVRGFRTSSYRRMSPKRPAATITTASGNIGSDRTLHPWQNRVLSPAECAYLQTFPPDFRWGDALDAWGHTPVRKMIGEAVPPLFTSLHGRVLAALHEGRVPPLAIDAVDPRCMKARARMGERSPEDNRLQNL